MGRPIKDLAGKRFGYWKVLNFSFCGKNSHQDAYWTCQCTLCGKLYDVRSDGLQSGHSTKCKKCARLTGRGKYARFI